MITAPRWLLLLVGLVLSAHWMPHLALLHALGLRLSWIGSAAWSLMMFVVAWIVVEYATEKAGRTRR